MSTPPPNFWYFSSHRRVRKVSKVSLPTPPRLRCFYSVWEPRRHIFKLCYGSVAITGYFENIYDCNNNNSYVLQIVLARDITVLNFRYTDQADVLAFTAKKTEIFGLWRCCATCSLFIVYSIHPLCVFRMTGVADFSSLLKIIEK